MKGKIVRWVDDRGFGFIKSDNLNGDIFVHVS
ncbi:cold shock domain-containing protein, partial [Vibrio gallaecicus]